MVAREQWNEIDDINKRDSMNNKNFINGIVVLSVGLFASSLSSFPGYFAVLGTATDFARGFFDGISAGAFCVAVFVLVRSRRAT